MFARYVEYSCYFTFLLANLETLCLLGMLNTVVTLLKRQVSFLLIRLLGMLNTVVTLHPSFESELELCLLGMLNTVVTLLIYRSEFWMIGLLGMLNTVVTLRMESKMGRCDVC